MILLILLLATIAALVICLRRGIASQDPNAGTALAAGLGAGLGIIWEMVLGFGDAGLLSRLTFIGAGIGLAYCALFYGKRIRRLREEAKSSPDIFE